jgi:carbon monoxide dehydrogenase subunit G
LEAGLLPIVTLIGIPGIIGPYTGVLRLHNHSAHHYGVSVKATRAKGTGSIYAMGTIRLVEVNSDSTLLRYCGEIQVSRPWRVFGARGIRGFARLPLGQFIAAAEAELEAERS